MRTSNALYPQSPQARAIYDLGIVSTIVFVLIFVAVAGAIVYAIFVVFQSAERLADGATSPRSQRKS